MVLLCDLRFRLGGRLAYSSCCALRCSSSAAQAASRKKTAATIAPFHITSSTRNLNQRTKLLELHIAVKVTAASS
jgi:hypothetical protein